MYLPTRKLDVPNLWIHVAQNRPKTDILDPIGCLNIDTIEPVKTSRSMYMIGPLPAHTMMRTAPIMELVAMATSSYVSPRLQVVFILSMHTVLDYLK